MDDFASVLRKGLAGAGKGTVLLAAGFAAGLVGAAALLNYADIPAGSLATVGLWGLVVLMPQVVLPFITGGALGYALEAASGGSPGRGVFFASARRHYFSLLIAGLFIFFAMMLLNSPAAFLEEAGIADISLICMVDVTAFVLLFVVLMFLEFYDVIIVAEGVGFGQGLAMSVDFVRKHLPTVVPFFIIVLVAKFLVQLPSMTAIMLRYVSYVAANYSLYANDTANGTLNSSYLNDTLAAMSTPFSAPSLISIAVLQVLVQTIVFAFLYSYKAHFYLWLKNRKAAKKITDFDYDFSQEDKQV